MGLLTSCNKYTVIKQKEYEPAATNGLSGLTLIQAIDHDGDTIEKVFNTQMNFKFEKNDVFEYNTNYKNPILNVKRANK